MTTSTPNTAASLPHRLLALERLRSLLETQTRLPAHNPRHLNVMLVLCPLSCLEPMFGSATGGNAKAGSSKAVPARHSLGAATGGADPYSEECGRGALLQNGPPDAPVAYEKVCIHLCVCVAAIRAFVDVGRDVGIVSKILLRGVWAASLLFHSQLSFPIFLSAGFTAFGLFFGQCRPP